ncbi:type IX secretion system membrane protein PorP/SprF [Flagellimonas nanhaiensis]|uniref:Type IX secretion system membrane protein PorP/SprF n=1 Tax=Flagellimonas nanhaiensis TaxID=2292706 RepID=A0A371JVA1_9FLAO|nr:type IX secretion system membrane protein PorP/SprF [Allomuricauda nanhaiensis]RDY61700.1 type IX secretion system membrane protein PorP/SprF [Allomuricauda nanhaiensis]
MKVKIRLFQKNKIHSSIINQLVVLLFLVISNIIKAQQDPQYTQYMYNTQIVNPAYTGSREVLSFGMLGRTQWINLDGSPQTGTLSVNTPIGLYKNMGLGLSIVYDQIGPAMESNVVVDYSYSIQLARRNISKLSFGLKAGADMLDVDYSKLNIFDPNDPFFQTTVDNELQLQVGAGIYFHTQKFYAGFSVPNFLNSKHFDEASLNNQDLENIAVERLHYFYIMGYVFDLSPSLKFKPATLVKFVSGAPLQWDMSANFLISEKLALGGSYRWNSSLSGLVGFQVNRSIFVGLAYDYQSTAIKDYSNGSYEAFLRFDIFNKSDRILTPRFF